MSWGVAPAHAADYKLRGSELRVTGKLKKGEVEKARASIASDKIKQVTIMSEGGDVDEGIALATWLHEIQAPLTVRRYCLSSCAQLVLFGSPSVEITEGAVVGMHAGPALIRFAALAAIERDPSILESESEALTQQFKAETPAGVASNLEKFKAFAGRFELALEPIAFYTAITLPSRIDKVKLFERRGEESYGMEMNIQCGIWGPSLADLKAIGVKLSPASAETGGPAEARRVGIKDPVCRVPYTPGAMKGTLEQIYAKPLG